MAASDIEERAARFLARREEPGWSATDQAQLEAWISESTLHEVTFLRLEYGWRKVERLAGLRAPPAESARQNAPRHSEPVRSRVVMAAAACVVAASALGALWYFGADLMRTRHFSTEVGNHSTVNLSDGSRVELNTSTRVRTRFDEKARNVWLDNGEAYFDVKPDPAHPFVVFAAGREVRVLGTRFSVRVQDSTIRVAVAEGQVRVGPLHHDDTQQPVVVSSGRTAVTTENSTLLLPVSTASVARQMSWRQGVLVFDQTTLASAAAEFNRYNRKKLIVSDAAGQIRIGGSFESTNVEAFARILRDAFDLNTVEQDDTIQISN